MSEQKKKPTIEELEAILASDNYEIELLSDGSIHSIPKGALAEALRSAEAWQETAAQAYRDVEFYRGIVHQVGEMFGVAARTSDDGSIQEDVLALRVPELVAELRKDSECWHAVCNEILEIMKTYHEQEARGSVDTPGGLEHMGDVWRLLGRWETKLKKEGV